MQFENVRTCALCPHGGGPEHIDDPRNLMVGNRSRYRPAFFNRYWRGRHSLVAALARRQRTASEPMRTRGCLSATVAQLHTKLGRRNPMEEPDDASERGLLLISVKGQTLRRVACFRRYICGFRKNHGGAGNGKLAQVHEVPIPGDPSFRRELGHRLNDDTIRKRNPSKLQWF